MRAWSSPAAMRYSRYTAYSLLLANTAQPTPARDPNARSATIFILRFISGALHASVGPGSRTLGRVQAGPAGAGQLAARLDAGVDLGVGHVQRVGPEESGDAG